MLPDSIVINCKNIIELSLQKKRILELNISVQNSMQIFEGVRIKFYRHQTAEPVAGMFLPIKLFRQQKQNTKPFRSLRHPSLLDATIKISDFKF